MQIFAFSHLIERHEHKGHQVVGVEAKLASASRARGPLWPAPRHWFRLLRVGKLITWLILIPIGCYLLLPAQPFSNEKKTGQFADCFMEEQLGLAKAVLFFFDENRTGYPITYIFNPYLPLGKNGYGQLIVTFCFPEDYSFPEQESANPEVPISTPYCYSCPGKRCSCRN